MIIVKLTHMIISAVDMLDRCMLCGGVCFVEGQMIALILMLIDIGYVSARCIAISIINLIESLRYNVIIVTSSFTAYALDKVKIVCGVKNTNAQNVAAITMILCTFLLCSC